MKKPGKNISLVLGSGGARGYAHIGVIEELERQGYEISSISGSSMGSLIGGLYACGKLDEYKTWVTNMKVLDVASLLDISWSRQGLIKGDKVFERLSTMTKNIQIEDLPILYTAVATDLKRNKEVWFQKGDLLEAIRASISIPSFFTPVEKDGMLLVDGGVLNPIPVAPIMSDHSDMTIAVNLHADISKPKILVPQDVIKRQSDIHRLMESFKAKVKNLIPRKNSNNNSHSLLDIMDLTFDSMQETLAHYRLAEYPPDIIINISKDICGGYDFYNAYEVIEAGRIATKEALMNSSKI